MAKSWNRTETWVALIALAIGGVIMGLFGLNMYMSATATPLHPDAASVPSVLNADPSAAWNGAVERGRGVVRATLSEQNLPGLSVAVSVGDHIVWAEGFGFADVDRREPVTPTHRFRMGTASKVLTSAAVGLLVERNQLNLDTEIQTYVPEFPKKQWPVTVRQLLTHTAGLTNDGGDEGPLYGRACERPVEGLEEFADRDLRFEPGTQYRFSNYGWILASAAIEAVSGRPLLEFMQEHVFDPLNMRDTRADAWGRDIPDRAMPYFPRFAADPRYGPDIMREIDLSCYSGSAVFLSTPSDLARFGMAINNGKVLEPETVELLQASQRLPSGEETGYGLGWDLETVTLAGKPTRAVGHDGEVLGGINMSLMTFPERRLVVVVMSNISYADTPGMASRIADAFAAEQPNARRETPD